MTFLFVNIQILLFLNTENFSLVDRQSSRNKKDTDCCVQTTMTTTKTTHMYMNALSKNDDIPTQRYIHTYDTYEGRRKKDRKNE